jgi:superfamily I DNA/RNA helicase
VQDAKDELIRKEGCVTLSTIKSAKGYDAPVSVLMAAQEFGTDSESRAGFYVGATRAQVRLYVTASEETQLVSEMREVGRRLPKLNPYIR